MAAKYTLYKTIQNLIRKQNIMQAERNQHTIDTDSFSMMTKSGRGNKLWVERSKVMCCERDAWEPVGANDDGR